MKKPLNWINCTYFSLLLYLLNKFVHYETDIGWFSFEYLSGGL